MTERKMTKKPNEKYLSGVAGRFQLEATNDIQATLKVTMSLGMWKIVKEALAKEEKYGVWQLRAMIHDLIESASTSAYARIDDEGNE